MDYFKTPDGKDYAYCSPWRFKYQRKPIGEADYKFLHWASYIPGVNLRTAMCFEPYHAKRVYD